MYRFLLSLLIVAIALPASAQQYLDTFRLFFDLNVPTLNKNAEKKIDLLIYNDKIISGSTVMVVGYADFLGSEQYNKNLSMQRAKSVKDYLIKAGIDPSEIKVCLGRGEIKRKDTTDREGNPIDRKVDIVVNNKPIRSEQARHFSPATTAGRSGKNKSGSTSTPVVINNSSTGGPRNADVKEIATLKEGQTLLLKNVYFPPGSHVIKPESYETLEKLYETLKNNPNLKISIEGHVCCIHGDVPDALDIDTNEPILSVNRAKAIVIYLVKRGIAEDRLQFVGYGKQHPIIQFERTEEDAEKNRRVEIRVVSNQ
jgi:outer membrane protein OmpA-like peptidoglycan-associated protein